VEEVDSRLLLLAVVAQVGLRRFDPRSISFKDLLTDGWISFVTFEVCVPAFRNNMLGTLIDRGESDSRFAQDNDFCLDSQQQFSTQTFV
jgi:hypothetical protein